MRDYYRAGNCVTGEVKTLSVFITQKNAILIARISEHGKIEKNVVYDSMCKIDKNKKKATTTTTTNSPAEWQNASPQSLTVFWRGDRRCSSW